MGTIFCSVQLPDQYYIALLDLSFLVIFSRVVQLKEHIQEYHCPQEAWMPADWWIKKTVSRTGYVLVTVAFIAKWSKMI